MNQLTTAPGELSAGVWEQPEMREALAAREVSAVYRLLRKHGVSQRQIAAMTGQSQSEVSEILKGRQVMAYDVLTNISDGLGVPRGYMGLAYDETTAIRVVGASDGRQAEEDESVKRRRFLAHAAQISMGAAVFGPESGTWSTEPARPLAPARIGMTDVRQVKAATRALRALDYQYGDGFSRDAFVAQLSWAEGLQKAEVTPEVEEELTAAIAELQSLLDARTADACEELESPVRSPERELASESELPEPSEPAVPPGPGPRRPVAQASQRAIKWASKVLPALDRERYQEECMCELDDLAQSPHPRRAQLTYLLGLIIRVPALRFALRDSGAESGELAQ